MPEPNLFKIFTNPLNAFDIKYIVTGAVAGIIYGEPRITHDIDLVVALNKENVGKIMEAFSAPEFYCPPEEVLLIEAGRPLRGHFNIIHNKTGFKADMYLIGRDELHIWAMSHCRQIKMEGEMLWVGPPEYVILRKLEYYREGGSEKHVKDILSMLEVSHDIIDRLEIEKWISKMGIQKEWETILTLYNQEKV